MEQLPQEILEKIVDYVVDKRVRYFGAGPRGSKYVTVSRRWQYTLEAVHFRSLLLKSTDVPELESALRPSQAHRAAIVEDIRLFIVDKKISSSNANLKPTEVLHKVFRILQMIDQAAMARRGKALSLRMYPVITNFNHIRRFLPITEELPYITSVSEFWVIEFVCPTLKTASVWAMASRFINAKKLCISVYDETACFLQEHSQSHFREDLADGVSALPLCTEEFQIEVECTSYMKRVGFPWDVDDRYNSVLSCLIQNGCKKLRLENWHIVSPKLFWAPNDRSLGFPFWPRLQTIDIDMAVVTHEGNVFFEPDPEDKNYPELCRRMNDAAGSQDTGLYVAPPIQINCIPVPGIMNPLLIAIAGAIQRASCLEALNLELLSWSCRDLLSDVQSVTAHVKFQITYLVKGVLSRDQNGDEIDGPVGKTRLFWKTGKWRPDEEVQKAFREALVKDALILYD